MKIIKDDIINHFINIDVFKKVDEFRMFLDILSKINNINSLIKICLSDIPIKQIIKNEILRNPKIFKLTSSEIKDINQSIESNKEIKDKKDKEIVVENKYSNDDIRSKLNINYSIDKFILDNWDNIILCDSKYITTLNHNDFNRIYRKLLMISLTNPSIKSRSIYSIEIIDEIMSKFITLFHKMTNKKYEKIYMRIIYMIISQLDDELITKYFFNNKVHRDLKMKVSRFINNIKLKIFSISDPGINYLIEHKYYYMFNNNAYLIPHLYKKKKYDMIFNSIPKLIINNKKYEYDTEIIIRMLYTMSYSMDIITFFNENIDKIIEIFNNVNNNVTLLKYIENSFMFKTFIKIFDIGYFNINYDYYYYSSNYILSHNIYIKFIKNGNLISVIKSS